MSGLSPDDAMYGVSDITIELPVTPQVYGRLGEIMVSPAIKRTTVGISLSGLSVVGQWVVVGLRQDYDQNGVRVSWVRLARISDHVAS